MEGEHRGEPVNLKLIECTTRTLKGFFSRGARDNQLRNHRVKRARDFVASLNPGVYANAGTTGSVEHVYRAGRRHEVAPSVFTVDAELEGVARDLRVVVVEDAPLRDTELLTHEVDTGDLFADGVLHLEASVHFEERDGAVLANEELARARALVADLFENRLRGAVEHVELGIRQERSRSFFDELLVATLQRAVTGRHDNDVAVRVGETLGLDVTGLVQVLLDETLTTTEGRNCLSRG